MFTRCVNPKLHRSIKLRFRKPSQGQKLLTLLLAALGIIGNWKIGLTQSSEHQDGIVPKTFIILRSLQRVPLDSVERTDINGLQNRDGSRIGWDEVLEIPSHLPNFDQWQAWRQKIGDPLYRLKFRLRSGDWNRADEIAKNLSDELVASQAELAFFRNVASFKAQLANGNYERAVQPWLELARDPQCVLLTSKEFAALEVDEAQWTSGLSRQLWPIFFDESAAEEELVHIRELGLDWSAHHRMAPVYAAGLMMAVPGERESLKNWLREPLWDAPELSDWKAVFGRWTDSKAIRTESPLNPIAQRIDLFYQLQEESLRQPNLEAALRLIDLVPIPARGSEPIAAGSLDRAATVLSEIGQADDAQRLREWLREQYPGTFHARRLNANQ